MAEEDQEKILEETGREAQEEKAAAVMECALSYSLADESGEARGRLDKDKLTVLPKFGEALLISYREIVDFAGVDYRLALDLASGEKLTLFNLGYQFEDFTKRLAGLRNEVLLGDLLMKEALKYQCGEAEIVYTDQNGNDLQKGECEIRLYETALLVISWRQDPVRIPYSYFTKIESNDYQLTLNTEFGETLVLSKMGRQFDSFVKMLSQITNELSQKIQVSIKELLPTADSIALRKLARLMKEGWAVRRAEIEAVSPVFWEDLEQRLTVAGIKEEYDFLMTLSQPGQICIGMKRGLFGEPTDYLWFLIPIYNVNPDQPGNAVAMEATSGEGSGRATYFFRITSRKDYAGFQNIEAFTPVITDFIKNINRGMLEINFRREPIYLPDRKLKEPGYLKYLFAVKKIPALRTLRELFIGRVIHSTPEQWKKDVSDLLKFNVTSKDDSLKWQKNEV